MQVQSTPAMVNGFEIFESTKPHTVWGTVCAKPTPLPGRNSTSSSSLSSSRSQLAINPRGSDLSSSHRNDSMKRLSAGSNDTTLLRNITVPKEKTLLIASPTTHPLEPSRTIPSTPNEHRALLSGRL